MLRVLVKEDLFLVSLYIIAFLVAFIKIYTSKNLLIKNTLRHQLVCSPLRISVVVFFLTWERSIVIDSKTVVST